MNNRERKARVERNRATRNLLCSRLGCLEDVMELKELKCCPDDYELTLKLEQQTVHLAGEPHRYEVVAGREVALRYDRGLDHDYLRCADIRVVEVTHVVLAESEPDKVIGSWLDTAQVRDVRVLCLGGLAGKIVET